MMNEQNPKNSGLRLERFSQSNADLVLKWRNAQHVRANSLNDDVIKREDHLRFVESIKDRTDRNFFIVHVEGYPEAVLNVNSNDGVGSWGCYLGGGRTMRPGIFPMLIAIAGFLAFNALSLQELQSDVLESNTSPQTMNDYLAIPITDHRVETRPSGQEIHIICYALTKDIWPTVLCRIQKVLTKRQRLLLEAFFEDPLMRISD